MSVIDTLVVDRSLQDVLTLTKKGHYNLTDLNRVGAAMRYLSARFSTYGYVVTVTSRINWTVTDMSRQENMDAYLLDVKSLRDVLTMMQSTPNVPNSMSMLTWNSANDIEQILADIDSLITRAAAAFERLGSFGFYAGADPLPSAVSDRGRNWAELDAYDTTWAQWEDTTFYVLMYGPLGRTWAQLDALRLTWLDWGASSFYALQFGDFQKEIRT